MRKFFLLSSLFVAALFTGCSSNDEPALSGNQEISNGEPRYLAVTLTTSSDSRSRAEGDEAETTTSPDYEHGLELESKINAVNLYFFDAQGNPAAVKADGSNTMSVLKSDISETGNEGDNISNGTKAVIVIQTPKDKAIPAQIVAIINKDAEKTYAGLSIAKLQEELTDGKNTDGFVMTNSVYVAGNALHIGAEVSGHLHPTRDAALANPVTIYVERTLAKVRLTAKIQTKKELADGTIVYNPNKVDSDPEKAKTELFGTKQIYVKFLGWNTTATSVKNRLVKVIDETWNAGWNWYDAYRFRSFWAMNAPDNEYEYFKFDVDNNAAKTFTQFDGSEYTYLKENAAVGEDNLKPTTPSQVIIAAQLVDEDGKAIEMAEYGGIRMSVEDLKTAFANALSLYYKQEAKDADENVYYVYTKILPSEIELITATEGQNALTEDDKEAGLSYLDSEGNKRYLVYATLTDAAKSKIWYAQALNDDTANPSLSSTEIKAMMLGLGGAKVWTAGKTYFYFDIRHLGHGIPSAEFGQFGVVRNHVYDAGLSTLVGLGTPVYKPGEVIIPEHPSDDETYIAAEIKVLSWRLVNQNIDLEW